MTSITYIEANLTNQETLSQFELEYKVKLPKEYFEFLRKVGFGRLSEELSFSTGVSATRDNEVFNDDMIDAVNSILKAPVFYPVYGDKYFVIAECISSSQVLISLDSDDYGKIYFFDYYQAYPMHLPYYINLLESKEREFKILSDYIVIKIADSFSQFIDQLYVDNTEPENLVLHEYNLDQIKKLLDEGMDIESVNSFNQTLLQRAAITNNFEVSKYLIEKGANINFCLQYSVNAPDLKILDLLVSKGADLNQKDTNNLINLN